MFDTHPGASRAGPALWPGPTMRTCLPHLRQGGSRILGGHPVHPSPPPKNRKLKSSTQLLDLLIQPMELFQKICKDLARQHRPTACQAVPPQRAVEVGNFLGNSKVPPC